MAIGSRIRPARRLLVMFVGITAVSATALGWAAWKLTLQDRALVQQRALERRDHLLGLTVETLSQRLAQANASLDAVAAASPAERERKATAFGKGVGTHVVIAAMDPSRNHFEAYPQQRLAYYPTVPPDQEIPAGAFAAADAEEWRGGFDRAIAIVGPATGSAAEAIRAGAFLRVARIQRKAGREIKAFEAYTALTKLRSTRIAGVPADLVARGATCELLGRQGDRSRQIETAAALRADLIQGRWRLERAAYDDYVSLTANTLGAEASPINATAEVLSEAVAQTWEQLRSRPERDGASAPRSLRVGNQPVLVVHRSRDGASVAMFALSGDIESAWLGSLRQAEELSRTQISLADPSGVTFSGPTDTAGPVSMRLAASTGLPWTVSVASAPSTSSGPEGRSHLFTFAIAALGLLVVGGSYLIGRAVSRELQVARQQADFVSAVSHEFRTPLTAVRQLSELLTQDRVPDETTRREFFDAIRHESSRLHRLVEGLLRFGRMEAGAMDFQFEPMDGGAFVESVVSDFRREAQRLGFEVVLATDGVRAHINADREALASALWNLLDNAVKYSPECRTVWVETHGRGSEVAIRVRDQGVGIDPADRLRLFGAFVRGRSARTLGVPGTGIGLSVARRIVLRHGGSLNVESELGAGTTFTIVVPATIVSQRSIAPEPRPVSS